jgi:exopolysaccharide biosynthesis protein
MVARLRLIRVLVVVARWSKDLLVIYITFRFSYTAVDEYEWIGGFSQKKVLMVSSMHEKGLKLINHLIIANLHRIDMKKV